MRVPPTMAENRKAHWDQVYSKKSPEELTWFQTRPEVSLALIGRTGLAREARIIDVGGGTSRLTAFLLETGYRDLSILDVSDRALELARGSLGSRGSEVEWYGEDLTEFEPPHRWDLWHDRAVFHFLTEESDRDAYRRVLAGAVEPGGHVLIATFSPEGPERCSGLEVVRYNPQSLQAELGPEYELRGSMAETHRTPTGGTQAFVYSWFQKVQ